MATIEQLLPGGSGASSYVLALRSSQYLAYHVGGALLTRALGDAVQANRVLLLAVGVAWPLAVRSLLRALGRDDRAAAFAPMVLWNRALLVGFLPFVASLPVAVFAVAVAIRQTRAPTRRRAVGLALLLFVLFYTHLSAWLTACAIAAAIAVVSCWTEAGEAKRSARPLVAVGPALVPSAVAALVWWSAASLAIKGQESTDVDRGKVIDAINLMPPWTFDVWTGHLDEIAACGWWLAYAVIVAAGLRRKVDARGAHWIVAALPFAIVLLIYVATPFRVGAAGLLNVRLAPLVTLFALVALRPRDDRWGTLPLGLAAAATVFNAGANVFEIRRVARENIGDIDALVASMENGSRVAILNFGAGPRRMFEWPYPFAGSLHRVRGGGIVAFSFVEVPHWSVHYAGGEGPPARPFLWVYNPCVYRFEDGAYYDYVLVQGMVDPWPPGTPGPPFAPVAHAGVFTLFAKTEGPPYDAPDRSPCNPPIRDAGAAGDADADRDAISAPISDAGVSSSP